MDELTKDEREFIARGIVAEICAAPPEYAVAWLGKGAVIARKLGCTDELRKAAGERATYDRLRKET